MLTTDTVGGVWRYSLELAHGFAARGATVTLVTLGPLPGDAQRAEVEASSGVQLVCTNLPLDWLADTPAQLSEAARALADIARRAEVDAVQLHTPAFVGDVVWPAPVVAATHSCVGTWWRAVRGGDMPADLAWRALAVARGIAAADAVIAPSRSFAAALRAQYNVEKPIWSVLNGRRPPPAVSRKPNRQIFTAGRLWDQGKNVATIDMAASRLDVPVLAAGPIAGANGDTIELRHVRLLGELDEGAMAAHFASSAVFVSVARYEPFGLAVLEAAQAGCALVLSDIPTFRELWDCAAVFVDPLDAARLAEVLRDLVRTPARCARLGDLARQRAASLTSERMTAATWRIHQELQQPTSKLAAD